MVGALKKLAEVGRVEGRPDAERFAELAVRVEDLERGFSDVVAVAATAPRSRLRGRPAATISATSCDVPPRRRSYPSSRWPPATTMSV